MEQERRTKCAGSVNACQPAHRRCWNEQACVAICSLAGMSYFGTRYVNKSGRLVECA